MDIISHSLMGAVAAQSAARPSQVRLATVIGLVAGLLADADVFIRSPDDPLLNLEFHRQFTHALLFVPVGGLIAALLLWPFIRRHLGFGRTHLLATLGFLPSGLLDACTTYGTQLLWPVSEARIAWNVIAIVDPLFTLTLALTLGVGLLRRTPLPARIGLVIALLYLLFGMSQRDRAEAVAADLAGSRGHGVERMEVKPTMGNLILWRSIYESGGVFYVDAIRVGLFSDPRTYPGGGIERFAPERAEWLDAGSVLARDIARFLRFSDGFVARHPENRSMLGDVRYSMLPNGLASLWGIEINPARQDRHVNFVPIRKLDAATRRAFLTMLRGKPLDGAERDGIQGAKPDEVQ